MVKRIKNRAALYFLIVFFGVSCREKDRDFFKGIGDKRVEFDSLNWWRIANKTTVFLGEEAFYETTLKLLKFNAKGFSYFDKEVFFFCEGKSKKSCEKFFDFSSFPNERYTLSDGSIIRFLFEENRVFFFTIKEIGFSNDTGNSDISIWALTEAEGIVGVAYYESETCEVIELTAKKSRIFEDVKEKVCENF